MLKLLHLTNHSKISINLLGSVSITYSFANQKYKSPVLQSSIGILRQKKAQQQIVIQNYKKNLPQQKLETFLNQHLVNVVLYYRHDCWRSQYVFNMLNLQEIGFKRISDYTYLNQATYALGLRQLKQQERWPTLKLMKPVTEPDIVTGGDSIYKYLDQLGLIKYQLDPTENPALNSHINQKIVPSLEMIFLHPRLTFEQNFHFDIQSSTTNAINYSIVGSIFRNFWKVTTKIIRNLRKISKNKQQYEASRQIFTKSMKQLEFYFQNGNQYIGGQNISHMDLYLYSIICTKLQSSHFEKYLKEDIKGEVWNWIVRMRRATAYNRERVTLL